MIKSNKLMNQLSSDCILIILSRSEVEGVLKDKKEGNLNRIDRLVGVTTDKTKNKYVNKNAIQKQKKIYLV